ncbi:MAG: hypothetical protein AAGH89_17920, partial [Verrucomicrobiota bacterium]
MIEETGGTGRVDIETDPFRAMQLTGGKYELVVVDMTISGFDGSQLLLMLKNRIPTAKFVALSADANELDRFQAVQNGANVFYRRPATHEEFEQLIHDIYHLLNPGPNAPAAIVRRREKVDVLDLISVECLSGNNTLLHITGEEHSADVFIYQGELFHAQCPGATGEDAFNEVIDWSSDGLDVSTHRLTNIPPRTIEKPWKELVKENKVSDAGLLKRSTQKLFVPGDGGSTVHLPQEMAEIEAPALSTKELPKPKVPSGELPDPSGPLPHLTQTGSLVRPEEQFHADSL